MYGVGESELYGDDSSSRYFSTWVDGFNIPSLLVTLDLSLIWANQAALILFSSRADFQNSNGVMSCGDKVQTGELRTFLAGLGDAPDAWTHRGQADNQTVRAEAVRPPGLAPAAALMIYPSNHFYWSNFDKFYGLTRSETVVIKRIVNGEAADVIARDLSVTLETVRTHVRRAYAKLGTTNREQLFALLCQFRVR